MLIETGTRTDKTELPKKYILRPNSCNQTSIYNTDLPKGRNLIMQSCFIFGKMSLIEWKNANM